MKPKFVSQGYFNDGISDELSTVPLTHKGPAASTQATTWEELRKEARKLENDIDLKLVSFSKLGASYSDNAVKSSLSSVSSRYHTMTSELEQAIERLTQVNDRLTHCLYNQSSIAFPASSKALQHTLQRHRDILQDYQQEYRKTKLNIDLAKQREELLGSVRVEIAEYKTSSGLNPRTALLLQEHDHAMQSERLLEEQLSKAENIKENLRLQHSSLRSVQHRVTTVMAQFPVINHLIQKINWRSRREVLILAAVITLCSIFLLWYARR